MSVDMENEVAVRAWLINKLVALNESKDKQIAGLQAEVKRLNEESDTIRNRVQFLLGFIDAGDPKSIGLSSEHSVGEQIVKLVELVKENR